MFIIAGLGNPTKKYENTRHNTGFAVIDRIAEKYNIAMNQKKFNGICGTGVIEGQKVLLLKPQTFMNLSGRSVGEAVDFHKLDPEEQLIVIYDDTNLAPGQLRIRMRGSAGGHNGMKDIISRLGTQNFARIRVGIGEKPEAFDLADYVLSRFSPEEREQVGEAAARAAEAVGLLVRGESGEAMTRYNKKAEETQN